MNKRQILLNHLVCLFFLNVFFVQANMGQISVDIEVNGPTCHGYTDGTATAHVQNGTPPYTYLWSNFQSGQTTFGIGAGAISVTVTDANQMSASASVTVIDPPLLTSAIAPAGSVCNGSQGDFIGSASGGVPPYIFLWSNGDRDSILEMPAAGFYMLTVNDANGCKSLTPLVVNEPLQVTVITIDVICPMWCDGSAAAEVTSGTGPFTFLWNTGDTTQILGWLPPGYYEVTVTDANGCTAVAGDSVYEPPPTVIDLDIIYSGCDPTATADVRATASGGTPPYTYEWSTGAWGTMVYDLPSGDYWITVTDANNCKQGLDFTITTGGLDVDVAPTHVSCGGTDDGSAAAVVNNGTAPFTYQWNTGSDQPVISNLTPGVYSVTVTDANGCTGTDTDTVKMSSSLILETSSTPANCVAMDDGSATVVAMGGLAPFMYQWSNGGNTSTITNLTPGWYYVTVTDAAGCEGRDSAEVKTDTDLIVQLFSSPAFCGDNSGQIATVVNGGTPPFDYQWNDPAQQTTPVATNLFPGSYTVKVTDAVGCMAMADTVVVDTGGVQADFEWEVLECFGDSALVRFLDRSTGNISSWNWDFGRGRTSSDQNPEIIITRTDTTVSLTINNFLPCTDDITKTVRINFISVGIMSQPDTTICLGDTILICVINQNPIDNSLQIDWMQNPWIVGDTDTSKIVVVPRDTGMYWFYVNIDNSIGCNYYDSTKITVKGKTPAVIPDSITYTQCDSFYIDFFAHGFNPEDYTWYFGDPSNPDANYMGANPRYLYPDTGAYIIQLIPKDICTDTVYKEIVVGKSPMADFDCPFDACSDTVKIQFIDKSMAPSPITAWHWTFSTGDTSDLQNPMLCITEPMDLEIRLVIEFETGCTDTIIKRKRFEPFICYIEKEIRVCYGVPTELNPGADSSYTYIWSPGMMLDDSTKGNPIGVFFGTTMFTVNISKGQCSKDVQVTVYVTPEIELEIVGDTVVCDSTPVLLKAISPQAISFEWSETRDFADIFSALDSVFVIPGRPSTYYLRVRDTFDCIKIDSFTVGNYAADIQIDGPDLLCAGTTAKLMAISQTPGDSLIYFWTPESAILSGQGTNMIDYIFSLSYQHLWVYGCRHFRNRGGRSESTYFYKCRAGHNHLPD